MTDNEPGRAEPAPADGPHAADPAARSFAALLNLSGGGGDIRTPPRRTRNAKRAGDQSPRRRRWSGPGPSPRDPQALGAVFATLARTHGWGRDLQRGRVLGQWDLIVGQTLAEKTRPVSLHEGVLTIQAVSTAWATQLRLELRRLHARINEYVGPDVVSSIRVQGPATPSWKKGRRSVRGRGPRDTYG